MKFSNNLIKAKFVKRYKRFFSDHILENGQLVTAHCPNTGAMTGVAKEGVTSWLSESDNPKRKLKWTWELTQENDTIVGVNTHNPNKIIQEAINNKEIKELLNYKTLKREVKYGVNSKIDIFLQDENKVNCYVEIKNVHLSREKGLAEFPDGITSRGTKHLNELINATKKGFKSYLLFVIQREDCNKFMIAKDIDPEYSKTLIKAIKHNVKILCYDCKFLSKGIILNNKIKFQTNE